MGCGRGELLLMLSSKKNARVQGIELDDKAVQESIIRGLDVFQSDIESGLSDYPDGSFDYVILNQSMQEVKNVDYLLKEALRVGRKVVVGLPNFAHFRARIMLALGERAPITEALPHRWHDTPNVRFLSILDFKEFCGNKGFRILKVVPLGAHRPVTCCPNLFALNAVFILAK